MKAKNPDAVYVGATSQSGAPQIAIDMKGALGNEGALPLSQANYLRFNSHLHAPWKAKPELKCEGRIRVKQRRRAMAWRASREFQR